MSEPAYGRLHVAEPPSSLRRMHVHDGGKLSAADHEPAVPVLDQGDLHAQGIRVSQLVPGARDVNQLGSCVANASVAHLSTVLPAAELRLLSITADPVACEEFAIELYHGITFLTGDPAAEFPPADPGTSGLFACQYLEAHRITGGHLVAHGTANVLSLMQRNGVICGQPYLAAWEDPPGPDYFIDGDGSLGQLQRDIAGGVAGGHETYWSAIERVAYDDCGRIDPFRTVIRFRQSWGPGWADHGSAYAHLSTFAALAHWCDWRQFHPRRRLKGERSC